MGRAPQVLVVEDDEEIREILVELLDDHGYVALGAVHGRDALEKLAALETLPRLILLDLMMPVMDGKTFRLEQLRDPALRAIPVVVISAFRNLDASIGELQPAGHLKKPLDVPQLLSLVERHVRAGDSLAP